MATVRCTGTLVEVGVRGVCGATTLPRSAVGVKGVDIRGCRLLSGMLQVFSTPSPQSFPSAGAEKWPHLGGGSEIAPGQVRNEIIS